MYYKAIIVLILWVCFCSVNSSITITGPAVFEPCQDCPEPYKVPRVVEQGGDVPVGVIVRQDMGGGVIITPANGGEFCMSTFSLDGLCGIKGIKEDGEEIYYNDIIGVMIVQVVVVCNRYVHWEVTLCMNLPDVGEYDEPQMTVAGLVLDAYKGRRSSGKCRGCPKPCNRRLMVNYLWSEKVINGRKYKQGNYVSPKIKMDLGLQCLTVTLVNGEPFCLKMLYLQFWEKDNNIMPEIAGDLESGGKATGDPTGQKLTALYICHWQTIKEWLMVLCAEKNPQPEDPPSTKDEKNETVED